VTARVTTLKGPDAGAYYVDGPGRYYLDGDEPPGRWLGRGAEALGLAGEVDDDDFLALMDGRDPTGRAARHQPPRPDRAGLRRDLLGPEVGVGPVRHRRRPRPPEVLDAHDAAVAAASAGSRTTPTAATGSTARSGPSTPGVIAAAFRQHTSRAHDPQIHTHLVIANRVMAPDGRWLALDARTLKCDQRTVSALYAAGLRAELTARLGVRWNGRERPGRDRRRPRGGPRRLLPAHRSRWPADSTRSSSASSTPRPPPTPRERWRIEREAALRQPTVQDQRRRRRPSTSSGRTSSTPSASPPSDYVDQVTGRPSRSNPTRDVDRDAVVAAVSSLRDTQSVWRPAEITREIAAALPTRLGGTAAETVGRAQRLASHGEDTLTVDISRPVPEDVPLRRGRATGHRGRPRPDPHHPMAILDEEEHILELTQRWSARRQRRAGPRHRRRAHRGAAPRRRSGGGGAAPGPRRRTRRHRQDHRHAARPSPGSTPRAGCASASPRRPPRPRCSPSTPASSADTLDKLLIEHRLDRPPQHRYDLPPGRPSSWTKPRWCRPTPGRADRPGRPAGLAPRPRRRPDAVLRRRPLRHVRPPRRHHRRRRARPGPPVRRVLGTRRQPSPAPRRHRRRRPLRPPRPTPRRHLPPDGHRHRHGLVASHPRTARPPR
jgi:conjugative relaxase-like TrwC/TraI family protein